MSAPSSPSTLSYLSSPPSASALRPAMSSPDSQDGTPKAAFRKSPGSQYIAYNHECFDEMKYRDLQKLAAKLQLGGRGTKNELIHKLHSWHKRTLIHYDRDAPIQNFSMIQVAIAKSGKSRVSPRLLSPITKKAPRRMDGTPIGILSPTKKAKKASGMAGYASFMNKGVAEEDEEETPPAKKKKGIRFSIFNGVQLISPREPKDSDEEEEEEEEEDWEYEEEEEEVEEEEEEVEEQEEGEIQQEEENEEQEYTYANSPTAAAADDEDEEEEEEAPSSAEKEAPTRAPFKVVVSQASTPEMAEPINSKKRRFSYTYSGSSSKRRASTGSNSGDFCPSVQWTGRRESF